MQWHPAQYRQENESEVAEKKDYNAPPGIIGPIGTDSMADWHTGTSIRKRQPPEYCGESEFWVASVREIGSQEAAPKQSKAVKGARAQICFKPNENWIGRKDEKGRQCCALLLDHILMHSHLLHASPRARTLSASVVLMEEDTTSTKRPRACDKCRTKKHNRADFPSIKGDNRNSHMHNPGELSDSYSDDYINSLKLRLKAVEAALERAGSREPERRDMFTNAIRTLVQPFSPPHPDDSDFIDIADSLRALSLSSPPPDPGFQGKSSAAMLVKAAVTAKAPVDKVPTRRNTLKPWALKPESEESSPKWEDNATCLPPRTFPSDFLIESLVSLYFSNVDPFIPLLHRPTFEDGIAQRLHINNSGFGETLLLVCALGSLYLPPLSYQDRVKMAWKCYEEVDLCARSLCQQPSLYDLQAYCVRFLSPGAFYIDRCLPPPQLAAQFLHRTSNPRFAWSLVGFGVRLAQDIGAHRRGGEVKMTIDAELEKRAIWILLLFDTQLSGALGRAATLDLLEVDISLPAEWPVDSLCPPHLHPDTPSPLAFFNCLINLYRILHFTLRTLYTLPLPRIQSEPRPDVPRISSQLSTALDRWFATLPEHLVWHPDRLDPLFFDQSAALHCFYYYTRIFIHRALLPAVVSRSAMQRAQPSLVICANAARECIDVADTHRRRRPSNPLPFSQVLFREVSASVHRLINLQGPVFTAAMMLLLGEWGAELDAETGQDLILVRVAINILASQRACDVLGRLLSLDESDEPDEHWDVMLAVNGASTTTRKDDGSAIENRFSIPIFLPPVFVGDEEIPRTRGYRRPVVEFYDTVGSSLVHHSYLASSSLSESELC
ncbi:fungal-specific transcription factor domain-containing protein [Mycena polygramma]|nr:fungal-specific transcription factor domain-containing protein [Mycena polygramma]